MNFVFGASGFAKEVDWLVNDIYQAGGADYRTDFFVDRDPSKVGRELNGKQVILEDEFFSRYREAEQNVFIAVADPAIRCRIAEAVASRTSGSNFPVLVHPAVSYDKRRGKVALGQGTIICAGAALTTDIVVGEFVHVNLNCTIGHDAVLEGFVTLSPGVSISGSVLLGRGVYLGTGAVVLPGLTIGPGAVIGAGAVVSKHIEEAGTYVGMPARKVGGR